MMLEEYDPITNRKYVRCGECGSEHAYENPDGTIDCWCDEENEDD